MTRTIAEDFLLIAYGADGRPVYPAISGGMPALRGTVAGALLSELVLDRRLELAQGLITVVPGAAASTGTPALDAFHLTVASEGAPHPPEWWISSVQSDGVNRRLLGQLVRAGVLGREWRFGGAIYPERDPSARAVIRAHLAAALYDPATAPPRATALLALIAAARIGEAALPGLDPDIREDRLGAILRTDPIARAARTVLDDPLISAVLFAA
ncbi:GOLPH3/VPS74 family protein [Longispora albida]|uniref:GOLPH3/VPS74 family protein n=1 Tax=Longispora albida TaxID=203523 RepID=UPI000374875C|nr:GPP34 family phosphoprotein [Longispora albida]